MSQEASRPFFSVITVVHNAVSTIEDCIKSVETQSFRDFEYIVVDSLSDDGTSELISKHLDSIDKYVREKDSGIYDAMNKAIAMCEGEYIGIINADDAYFEDTLKRIRAALSKNPEAEIIYGGVEFLSPGTGSFLVDHTNLARTMIAHPSCFVSTHTYRELGTFNSSFKIAADYDFMLRAFSAGAVFHNTGEDLAKYRPGGASARHRFKSIRETISIQAHHLEWSNSYRKYRLIRFLLATYIKFW
jgi:glycosyltransferase involved in cell wall biosynthesis